MKKGVIAVVFFFLLSLFGVAYTLHKQELAISGQGNITNGYFKIIDITSNEEEMIQFNGLTIEGNIQLETINTAKTYTIIIGNKSSLDYLYLEDMKLKFSNDDIQYTYSNLNSSSIIYSDSVLAFQITFSYKGTTLPMDTSLDFKIEYIFADASILHPDRNYAQVEQLNLFLHSHDQLENELWPDHYNNNNYQTTNLVKTTDSYYFSGNNTCVLTNQTLVPTKEDYTIEVYFKTSEDIISDQAIISQKSLTVNRDDYRSKLYIKDKKIKFFNAVDSGKTDDLVIKDNIEPNKEYVIQVVKKGSNLYFYVNGVINTIVTDFTKSISSATTQIGCFMQTGIMAQNFKGDIYATRIYKVALTNKELRNNIELDLDIHHFDGIIKSTNFYTQLLDEQLTVSGTGLQYISSEDRYLFKGKNANNYVQIDGKLWRIMSIEKNNTIKLVSNEFISNIAFDNAKYRDTTTSTYCLDANNLSADNIEFGCNAWGSSLQFTNGSVSGSVATNASINDYLNTTYYNALSEKVKSIMLDYEFEIGGTGENDLFQVALSNIQSATWKGKVGLPTVLDVARSDVNATRINSVINDSYFNNGIGNNYMWTMTPLNTNTYDLLTFVGGYSLKARRASRTEQLDHVFIAYPVIIITSELSALGNGSKNNPYYFPFLELGVLNTD